MTTLEFAEKIVGTELAQIPEDAVTEAKRSFLNWSGVAIGASRHPMVDMVLDMGRDIGCLPKATILGRSTKADAFTAALVNGISSHIFDYDDTLLDTVLHPSAPIFPALLAYAELYGGTGQDVLRAFVVGVEVAQRVAQVVYPSHYNRGWHITGSVGAFGAAAAVGKLMGLDVEHMVFALGLAAAQPVGLREMFGTYTKPFHPGKASANGLMAAMLAQKGFTSSTRSIEAPCGFAHVTSEAPRLSRLTEGWGESWQIMNNSYKPFPCGVVIHPAIDGVLRLREQHGVRAMDVETLELRVHPLVLELTGKKAPATGLEAKFSVFHCAAAGLIDGWVGLAQFEDFRVNASDIVGLRNRVVATVDTTMKEDQVRVIAKLRSGRTVDIFVEHCLGSKENPMDNSQLERKFLDVTRGILDPARQAKLMSAIWNMDTLPSIGKLLDLTVPQGS